MPTVNLASEPANIVAGENPIVISLESGQNLPSGQDTPAEGVFVFDALIPEGYRVNFAMTSPVIYNQTFYSKKLPTKDNYFLCNVLSDINGATISANTITQIANSFAQCLQVDPIISNNYYINTSGNTVGVVAKVPGQVFAISEAYGEVNQITIWDHNGVQIPTTGITWNDVAMGNSYYQGGKYQDYTLGVEVYTCTNIAAQFGEALDAGDFVRLTEIQIPFNRTNIHRFDVHDICKTFVSTPKPDFNNSGVSIEDYARPFFCKYFDSYPLVYGTNTKRKSMRGQTGFFWVTNSSLDWQSANDVSSFSGSSFGLHFNNVPFLTNSPALKPSTRSSKELLYYLIPANLVYQERGLANLDVTCDVTFWDGSRQNNVPLSDDKTILGTGNTGNIGSTFYSNVGFQTIGLADLEESTGKKIKQADFSLKGYRLYYDSVSKTGSTSLQQDGGIFADWVTVSGHKESTAQVNNAGTTDILFAGMSPRLNFALILSGFSATLLSGSTSYGDVFVRFYDTNSGLVQTEQFTPSSLVNDWSFIYNGYYPCYKVEIFASVVGLTGNQKTRFQFTNNGGFVIAAPEISNNLWTYSKTKSFLFPYDEPASQFGVAFQNRKGTYDTFHFQGLKEETIEREYQDLTFAVTPEEDGSYAQGFKKNALYDVRLTKKIAVNSGWISETNFNWLKELLGSSNVYSYTDQYQNYLKLIDHKYSKNNQSNEYFLECTFLQTIYDNHVTI